MEQGLAQYSVMKSGQGSSEQMIQQTVQMLLQGVNPDELLKQGVPMEVIKEAIEILLAQEQQEQVVNSAPSTESGLAMRAANKM